MASAVESATSATLLGRLRREPNDQAAWREFVQRYGRKLYRWCRGWGLQEADAQDVTQTVLVKLAEKMRSFSYDPSGSFRAWLKTVARNAWLDFIECRRRGMTGSGDSQVLDQLHSVEARDDLVKQLEEEFDLELLEEAMARVRLRVEPHTWEAFRLTAIDGLPAADVAPRVGMQVAMVFAAKSKVQKRIQEEVRRLEEPREGTCEMER